ncbi:hypothetical protein M422DRAFT_55430 [Sphaerobolus stellatus SS14]|uniref:Uncharacterized protein n=1 Tax=Sphaerobolus stellatus (strain SS14) TaxID=990650 RepID=A0A0C9UMW7_SPHS4|nr:hypothetical protein M422DRAFT_55430 [Sphaerobolus stellatus SS14]
MTSQVPAESKEFISDKLPRGLIDCAVGTTHHPVISSIILLNKNTSIQELFLLIIAMPQTVNVENWGNYERILVTITKTNVYQVTALQNMLLSMAHIGDMQMLMCLGLYLEANVGSINSIASSHEITGNTILFRSNQGSLINQYMYSESTDHSNQLSLNILEPAYNIGNHEYYSVDAYTKDQNKVIIPPTSGTEDKTKRKDYTLSYTAIKSAFPREVNLIGQCMVKKQRISFCTTQLPIRSKCT